jgi:RimJ/RimL family protein N-acetyltransferase
MALRCRFVNPVGARLTSRLRLEPIGPGHAEDLWQLHRDPAIAEWYVDEALWTRDDATRAAALFGDAWRENGVSKWIAYDRDTGALVGRGGLSRWELEGHEGLEVGWGLRGAFWGRGLATEIGAEALSVAFAELQADEVIAFTEVHNRRSRAVMERLGMSYVRDIVARGLAEGVEAVQDQVPFALYRITMPEWRST